VPIWKKGIIFKFLVRMKLMQIFDLFDSQLRFEAARNFKQLKS